ncbi:MAG: hypothetical protein J7K88_10340 [Candidatus Fermentibacteraceae bacterium]|nr:hypothetical protein [Candidatus Fermentibacteraceae bacterium]
MVNNSARFRAGHFFLTLTALLFSGVQTGCGNESVPGGTELLPETGSISVVVFCPGGEHDNTVPLAVTEFPSTAAGQFLPSDEDGYDLFYSVVSEADSAGKLLVLVLPEGERFTGSRDHLIVQIDSNGLPVAVMPDIVPEMLEDSLWDDPVIRQETILQLILFLKPDMVLQIAPETGSSAGIIRFWLENAEQNNITMSVYVSSAAEDRHRGWGAFTGKGIENRILEGMDLGGFAATVRMISGLEWNTPGGGYPAMQAFYPVEGE